MKSVVITHQVVLDGLLRGLGVLSLDLGRLERVLDVQGARVVPPPVTPTPVRRVHAVGAARSVIAVALVVLWDGGLLDLRADCERVGVKMRFAARPDLLVDVRPGLGRVHGGLDAHALAVELAGADLGDVGVAVDLLIVGAELVVEVGLECQLALTDDAAEASGVKEGVVLQRADLVRRVDGLAAPEARVVDEVRAEHADLGRDVGLLEGICKIPKIRVAFTFPILPLCGIFSLSLGEKD